MTPAICAQCAELQLPEGLYVVELDRVNEFSPCQNGGIAAFLFEHGNAGCGDLMGMNRAG